MKRADKPAAPGRRRSPGTLEGKAVKDYVKSSDGKPGLRVLPGHEPESDPDELLELRQANRGG